MKCAFCVKSGMLLGHIVSAEGIAMDPAKVVFIWLAPVPTTPRELSQFVGQVWWHNWMLWYLADVAIPLNGQMKKKEIVWGQCLWSSFLEIKSDVGQSPDSSTTSVGLSIPCVCQCFWCGNRQRSHARETSEVVSANFYASRRLSSVEKNYSVTEREALGMIYSITTIYWASNLYFMLIIWHCYT